MAALQLELISPSGDVQFVTLDTGRGLINLGRHPENDVVLDDPGLAAFQALLDVRQRPFQLISLTEAGVSRELAGWDSFELGGYTAILLEDAAGTALAVLPAPGGPGGAAVPPPAGAAVPAGGAAANRPAGGPPLSRAMASAVDATGLDRFYNQIAQLPPDRADDVIFVEFTPGEAAVDTENRALDFAVEVRQSATCQAAITNGGDIVAAFTVDVLGLERNWVTIQPTEVNLNEGERATVAITFNVPRLPTSLAGAYFFAIAVTSANYPGRSTSLGGVLLVKPFYQFKVGELSPKQQSISWSQRSGQVVLPILNQGNSEAEYLVEAEDEERACRFEILAVEGEAGHDRQARVRVPANDGRQVPVVITPKQRRLVAFNRRTFTYTATVTQVDEKSAREQHRLTGQAQSPPLFGLWSITLAALTVIAALVWGFWPRIYNFGFRDEQDVAGLHASVNLIGGGSARLYWSASPFVQLTLNQSSGEAAPEIKNPEGELVVKPEKNTRYQLVGTNLLSYIFFFLPPEASRALQVADAIVEPVTPGLSLKVTGHLQGTPTDTAVTAWVGEPLDITVVVTDAEELQFVNNGVPLSLLDPVAGDFKPGVVTSKSQPITPDKPATYIFKVRNRFSAPGAWVEKSLTVNVFVPTPTSPPTLTPSATPTVPPTVTPSPTPSVVLFTVEPAEIIVGQSVKLTWSVKNVEKIKIDPLGEFKPEDSATVSPAATTDYVLTAGDLPPVRVKVVVKPGPTATPTATPVLAPVLTCVVPTDPQPQGSRVTIRWSTTGDVSRVELKSLTGSDQFVSTDPNGSYQTQPLLDSTQYELKAFNGAVAGVSQICGITIQPPPPLVSIQAFNDKDSVQLAPVSVTGNEYVFAPKAYSVLRILWSSANASTTGVTIQGRNLGPVDVLTMSVAAQPKQQLFLVALNSKAQPPAPGQNTYTITLYPQLAIPLPPTNLKAPLLLANPSLTPTKPLTLTWDFTPDPLTQIIDFRVYRAPAGQPFSFETVSAALKVYTDEVEPLCGVSYFVVATYLDLNGATLETPSSANSWQNGACGP